jgi:hypothetical protein
MTAELRALTAAVDLLRQQMADLPAAIIQNLTAARATQPPAPGDRGDGRPARRAAGGNDAGSALAASFARLLGPLAALATFLSQTTSGFAIFSKAIGLFAATLAPVLLPVFFVLGVALLALSEILMDRLLPVMEEWFKFVLNTAIPAIVRFVDVIISAAEALKDISSLRVGGEELGSGGLAALAMPLFAPMLAPFAALGLGADRADRATGGPGVGERLMGGARPEARGATGRGMADMLEEVRLAMGPQASSGSVASINTRAQMASFQSPFERRMLDWMDRIYRTLSGSARPGMGRLTEGGGGGALGAMWADPAGRAAIERVLADFGIRRRGGP